METLPILLTQDKAAELAQIAEIWREYNPPVVRTHLDRDAAMNMLKEVKAIAKTVEAQKKEIVAPMSEVVDKIRNQFGKPLDALKVAEAKIKRACLDYDAEEEKKRLIAQRIQQEAENKAAEEKRKALEAEAEAEKLFGNKETAAVIEMQAAEVAPAKIGIVQVKTEGKRTIWRWRLVDIKQVPIEYLQVNETLVNSIVKGSGGAVNIPGIEVYGEAILASVR